MLSSFLFIATLLVSAISTDASSFAQGLVSEKCLKCLCQVESHCKALNCAPDRGSLSCGYFQLKEAYWKDCGKPGTSWEACSKDLSCASGCVQKYMKRYLGHWCKTSSCETFARMHNGGPNGCSKSATDNYWHRVHSCLI